MDKTAERRKQLQCRIHPFGTLPELKFVVICARFEGQWLMSKHKKRDTWETQGGHIEQGETPEAAARRELYEESGVADAVLYPVCDYCGYDDYGYANGAVFLADIHHLGTLPESEMQEVRLFAEMPEELTYPDVSPKLYREAEKLFETHGIR